MATPRKHWFKVEEDTCNTELTNEELGFAVRLMGLMNNRRARNELTGQEAKRTRISKDDLRYLTGRERPAAARQQLAAMVARVSQEGVAGVLRMSEEDGKAFLEWENISIYQGWTPECRERAARELPLPTPTPTPTPTPKEEPPTPVAAAPVADASSEGAILSIHRGDPTKEAVRKIWPEVQKAAEQYGKRWEKLTPDRLAKLAARLRDHGPDPQVLVKAVHGAVAYWKKTMPDKDMSQYITTDTIFGAGKFSKYVEFASDPKTAPQKLWSQMTRDEQIAFQREGGMF